jgi:hypothetical protein
MHQLIHGQLIIHRNPGVLAVKDDPVSNTITALPGKQDIDFTQEEYTKKFDIPDGFVAAELLE